MFCSLLSHLLLLDWESTTGSTDLARRDVCGRGVSSTFLCTKCLSVSLTHRYSHDTRVILLISMKVPHSIHIIIPIARREQFGVCMPCSACILLASCTIRCVHCYASRLSGAMNVTRYKTFTLRVCVCHTSAFRHQRSSPSNCTSILPMAN